MPSHGSIPDTAGYSAGVTLGLGVRLAVPVVVPVAVFVGVAVVDGDANVAACALATHPASTSNCNHNGVVSPPPLQVSPTPRLRPRRRRSHDAAAIMPPSVTPLPLAGRRGV